MPTVSTRKLILTSLVAHVLGLTQVNPLLHRMPFRGLRAEGERWPILGCQVVHRVGRI